MARKRKSNADRALEQARADARAAKQEAKAQSKLAQKAYKTQIREMRPYLKKLKNYDLRKNISAGQKSYVTKAWEEYKTLTLRPTKVYRTKNKKRLGIAQKASQHTGTIKFDVAFVPTVSENAKIKIQGNDLIVSSKYVDEIKILFNMTALATDPEKEIQRVLDLHPEYSQFVMMAGEFVYNGGIVRSLVAQQVMRQLMKYAPGGESYENGKNSGPNHHYLNWAIGLKGFKSKQQLGVEEYLSAFGKASREKIRAEKSKRYKNKVKYGKKF